MRASIDKQFPGSHTRVVNSYTYAASVVSNVVSSGYIGMVKTIPQMYRYLYARAERATQVGPFRSWVHQFTANNLRSLIQEERPDVVVCTHAFPCGAMAEYARMFDDAPPVLGIVTDFAVHAYWANPYTRAYAVATPQMRDALAARGVEPQRVHVTGIPVREEFGNVALSRDELRAGLNLPLDAGVALVMGGGLGMGPLAAMLGALRETREPLCAVAIAGRSERAEQRIKAVAAELSYPVRVLRFVDNVYEYMHAADLLISKPGGLTSAEAMAAHLPMVLFRPLPGQEERNTQYLVRSGAAVRARDAAHLTRLTRSLLRDRQRLERMREATRRLAKPRAAREIAACLAELARQNGVVLR